MPSAPRPKRPSSASSSVPSASKSSKAKAASSPKAAAPSKARPTSKASKAPAASKKVAAPKPAPKAAKAQAPKASLVAKAPAPKAPAPKAQAPKVPAPRTQAPKAQTAKVPAPKKVKPSKPAPVVGAAAPEAPAAQPVARTGGLDAAELLERIVALIHERRGEDVVALDVHGLADYMDYLVIATGRSERQNRSIADGVMRGLKGLKIRPLVRPGPEDGTWICLDFVDVVVHVFDGITRPHYDLENLWGDAPRVPIKAPTLPPAVPQPRQELGAP